MPVGPVTYSKQQFLVQMTELFFLLKPNISRISLRRWNKYYCRRNSSKPCNKGEDMSLISHNGNLKNETRSLGSNVNPLEGLTITWKY
jgi:hypothetical protein